jgi:hypothetical protein
MCVSERLTKIYEWMEGWEPNNKYTPSTVMECILLDNLLFQTKETLHQNHFNWQHYHIIQ